MSECTDTAKKVYLKIKDKDIQDTVGWSLTYGCSWVDKVKAFHALYDAPISDIPTLGVTQMTDERLKLRLDLIEEEFEELKEATANRDVVEIADALGDIAYVISGYAIEAGIDLDSVVTEIHASNLTKLDGEGNVIRREDGKILKSDLYIRPNIAKVLGLEFSDS